MTITAPTVGRAVTDADRARWVAVAEAIRAEPGLLPFIRRSDEHLYHGIVHGLRALAIEARSEEWRDPAPTVGGRPEQLIPGTPGSFSDRVDWVTWLLMGGRGSGKSRTGAEATRELVLGRRWIERPLWALVGQTLDDVRINMVENTLLQVLPPGSVWNWNRGTVELWLRHPERDGPWAYLKGYSSETPRKLRGPNFHGAWADEIGTWKDADRSPFAIDTTWSNLKLAVRARDGGTWDPRIIATTTPRSVNLIRNVDEADVLNPGRGLYDDRLTVISNMSTEANIAHLADHFLAAVIDPLRGTRLFDQEVLGLLMDEALGALWSSELIAEMTVVDTWPEFQGGGLERVIIAVDPSVGAGLGDECGIIVAGLAADGRAYVLHDLSKRCPAKEWAAIVVDAYHRFGADAIVCEVNQGGELVAETLGRESANLPIVEVWAKRGKKLRAEPVALLSDRDRLRLAGEFPRLVHQMKTWDPSDQAGDSPDRLDAMCYAALYLLPVDGGLGDLVTVRRRGARR